MMLIKKIILFLACTILSFTKAQNYTESQIDAEIKKARILSINKPNKSIELCTKIYRISKDMGYKKGMLECNNILMAKLYDAGDFKKVVDISKEAETLAKEINDNVTLSNTYRLRGASYTELGFNDECLKELKKALRTAEKITSKNDKNYLEALIYTGFGSYSAHINAPMDSLIYYAEKSLKSTMAIDEDKNFVTKKYYNLAVSYMNLGMLSVATNRIKDAEMYLSKSLEISQNEKYLVNKNIEVTVLNEFAWLYYDQKKYKEAVRYAERAEALEKRISIPYIRRDIYEVYFKSYVELGEKETSKKYMNLYTKLNDSLVNVEKKAINTPVKQIMSEQGESYTNNIQRIILIALGLLISVLAVGWFFWRKNQNKIHEKYKNVIANLKNEADAKQSGFTLAETEDKIAENTLSISEDTTTELLRKLSKFEKSEKFLKKDTNLSSLSNMLNTNPRYLSEIIKQHRGKNFNNYLNGLRIHYITNKLYETPVFREYKISYLAEFCGFSSREVFAVIFKKETGVTPSYFINQLKKDNGQPEVV